MNLVVTRITVVIVDPSGQIGGIISISQKYFPVNEIEFIMIIRELHI